MVTPLVWSIFIGQNSDLTRGLHSNAIPPVRPILLGQRRWRAPSGIYRSLLSHFSSFIVCGKQYSSPLRKFPSTVVRVRPPILHSNQASHSRWPQPRPHSILSSLALRSSPYHPPSLFLSVPPAAPSLYHLPWCTTEIVQVSCKPLGRNMYYMVVSVRCAQQKSYRSFTNLPSLFLLQHSAEVGT